MAHVRPPDPRDRESRSGQDPKRAKIDQPTKAPTRKLSTAIGGSAFGTPIIEWVANDIAGLAMPELVAAEIAIGLSALVAYFIRDRA